MLWGRADSGRISTRLFMRESKLSAKFILMAISVTLLTMLAMGVFVIERHNRMYTDQAAAYWDTMVEHRDDQLQSLTSALESKGEGIARFLGDLAPEAIKAFDFARLENYVSEIKRDQDVVFAAVYDTEGKLLTLEKPPQVTSDRVLTVVRKCVDEYGVEYGTILIGMRKAPIRATVRGTEKDIAAAIAKSKRSTQEAINGTVRFIIALFLLGAVSMSAILYGAFNKMVLRPIGSVSQALSEIAQGRFDTRVTVNGHDEMADLGAAVNEMVSQLRETTVSRNQLRNEVEVRKAAQEQLDQSNRRFRGLFDNSPFAVLLIDRRKTIVDANPMALELLGRSREDMVGHNCRKLICPREGGGCPALDNGEDIVADECEAYRADGTSFPIIRSVRKIDLDGELHIIETFVDISEQKRAEERRLEFEARMQQAQKMESLGVLTGGIAHDFNNLLVAILGNADLARMDTPEDAPAYERLERVITASKQATELCKQMLAYSGHGRIEVKRINLNRVIGEMRDLLKSSATHLVSLDIDTGTNLPDIEADASQIRQVALNLVTNAAEATGDNGGTVTIRTGVDRYDAERLAAIAPGERLPGGEYVFIEVKDDGCGMDEETRRRMFDPFFTTKFIGRGLGLAATLGIIRSHRGAAEVRSELNKGTTVKVMFPSAGAAEEKKSGSRAGESRLEGGGTILLVDDEEDVRKVGSLMLARCDFSVVTAEDGEKAVEAVSKNGQSFVCVILDMTMPKVSGIQAFAEIKKIRPDLPVLVSSGYSEEDVYLKFKDQRPDGFVAKPYELASLKSTLSEIIGSNLNYAPK